MITGNIYKKGEEYYLLWDFTTMDEQRLLRRLLKGSDTRVGYRITHFLTKVNNRQQTGQMTIDRWGV